MAASIGQRSKRESLTRRLAHAEQQVMARRQRIAQCAGALQQNLREKIRSPMALLLAGGLGFAVERLVGARGPATSAPGRMSYRKLFSMATSLFMLARSLLITYRSATAKGSDQSTAVG
jgi:hypothetical protein